MTRIYDFTVVSVIWIIAVVIHLMAISLFSPDTALYYVATDGTSTLGGQSKADLWYEILAVWVPLMAGMGILAWAVIREYRRQALTARAPRP